MEGRSQDAKTVEPGYVRMVDGNSNAVIVVDQSSAYMANRNIGAGTVPVPQYVLMAE